MDIAGYSFPDGIYYDKNHFWAKVENGLVVMGATDFMQKMAGEITFVDLDKAGEEIERGKPFSSIESGKWVGRIYAMVSGKIEAVNEDLENNPELINQSSYDKGWLFKISPSDLEEDLSNLLRVGNGLEAFVEAEVARVKDAAGQ
ncbi:MAG: glycine cleavage system protein H [Deltaproteobacteria bacterium]|nr:glycine cleavage system protein H [Deltaproteobacteria bacterium]